MNENLQEAIKKKFGDYRESIGRPREELAIVNHPSFTYSHFEAGYMAVLHILKDAYDQNSKLDILTSIEINTADDELMHICEFIRGELCPDPDQESLGEDAILRDTSIKAPSSIDGSQDEEGGHGMDSEESKEVTIDEDIFS
jgi:hypothetical protein